MPIAQSDLDQHIQSDPDFQKMGPDQQVQFIRRMYEVAGYSGSTALPHSAGPELRQAPLRTGMAGGMQTEEPPVDWRSRTIDTSLLKNIITPAILPTILEAGGTALGSAFGPIGTITGMVGGGITGEGLNQLFGITKPDLNQILLAGAVPPAATAAVRAIQTGAKFFPPSKAARVLNEIAPQEAALRMDKFQPGQSSQRLFEQAKQSGDLIPMTETLNTIGIIKADLQGLSSGAVAQKREIANYLDGMRQKILDAGGDLDPAGLQPELRALGEMVGNMERSGAMGRGEAKRLFGSMIDDLDHAANVGSSTLKQARLTWKREKAIEDINDSITNATRINRGQGLEGQFNSNRVIADLKKDPFFTKSFAKDEQQEIFDIFGMLNKIPPLPVPSGVPMGSGRFWHAAGRAGAGGGLGAAAAGQEGAIAGAVAGAVIPPVAESVRLFTLAMQTKIGRALTRELLTDSKGILTPHVTGILSAYLTAQVAEPGERAGGETP